MVSRVALVLVAAACRGGAREATPEDPHAARRAALVGELTADGIRDRRVLAAIGRVPRHELVPEAQRARAYVDTPLPIGEDQTISQPYIVARMTELADLAPGERVLEVGTGSGYQAAVLAELGVEVFTIEIVEPLAARARADLDRLGYRAVHTRTGDGYAGWPEAAPFDAVLVTAAPEEIPPPLLDQLRLGGKLVAPVGPQGAGQDLVVVTSTADGYAYETLDRVIFVPMTGEAAR